MTSRFCCAAELTAEQGVRRVMQVELSPHLTAWEHPCGKELAFLTSAAPSPSPDPQFPARVWPPEESL